MILPASGNVTKKVVALVNFPKAVGRFANDMSTTRLSPPTPPWMIDGLAVPLSVQLPVRLAALISEAGLVDVVAWAASPPTAVRTVANAPTKNIPKILLCTFTVSLFLNCQVVASTICT
ncbi:MAG: hypothetical protein ABIQ18_36665 [Umezawaea sp.]